ncbi:hypothetical protein [uncultured Eudoraea sp.]|uniref:hypothetical protein n=1 Tax=uncultured Eudoraea sp. TaxID=1035614 RepID=UPI0026293ACC|nr:hypothetical protein [uncultured Eudoraea sp.]
MKKVLFFTFIIAFSASLSAQTVPDVKTSDVQKDGIEAISKENPNMDAQITDALMKDDGLQKETIDYLKSNPETTKSLTSILAKNKGSNKGIMKAILGDKDLATAAIDFISKNPELLNKAMKVIGM